MRTYDQWIAEGGSACAAAVAGKPKIAFDLTTYILEKESISMAERLLLLKWLICGGDPENMLRMLEACSQKSICGKTLNPGEMAYKCRDCQSDSLSAICTDCFIPARHLGHDYSMYRSGGGCCDCGDNTAWAPSGFCSMHSGMANDEGYDPLGTVTPRWVVTVIPVLQAIGVALEGVAVAGEYHSTQMYCDALIQLCRRGDALTRVVVLGLVTPREGFPISRPLTTVPFGVGVGVGVGHTLAEDPSPSSASASLADLPSTTLALLMRRHDSLDIRITEALHRLYYALLPDLRFKHAFAQCFVHFYASYYQHVLRAGRRDDLTRHSLLDFSVQILAMPLLLETYAISGDFPNTLVSLLYVSMCNEGYHAAKQDLKFKSRYLQDSSYGVIIHDLKLVLANEIVARSVLGSDAQFLHSFLRVCDCFHYVNYYRRQTGAHVPFSDENFVVAWGVQLSTLQLVSILANSAGKLLRHMMAAGQVAGSLSMARHWMSACIWALADWFGRGIGCENMRLEHDTHSRLVPKTVEFEVATGFVSFHTLHHRTFASLVRPVLKEVKEQVSLATLFACIRPEEKNLRDFFIRLLEHPLRNFVWCSQIRAGMWVRNGHMVAAQAKTYQSVFSRHSAVDCDLFCMMLCAAMESPDLLLVTSLCRFGLADFFQASTIATCLNRENTQYAVLLEDALHMFIALFEEPGPLMWDWEAVVRRQIIHELAIGPQTHSHLHRNVCRGYLVDVDFDVALESVATFKQPQAMEQGKFFLKEECWAEFSPFFYYYSKKDAQDATDRYKDAMKAQAIPSQANVPQLPSLPPAMASYAMDGLGSRSMQQIVLWCIHASVQWQNPPSTVMSDTALYSVLRLLQLMLIAAKTSGTGDNSHEVQLESVQLQRAFDLESDSSLSLYDLCRIPCVVNPTCERGTTCLTALLTLKEAASPHIKLLIADITDRLIKQSPGCAEWMQRFGNSSQRVDTAESESDTTAARRRRKQHVMRLMKQMQVKFEDREQAEGVAASKGPDGPATILSDGGTATMEDEMETDFDANGEDVYMCALCHVHAKPSLKNPVGKIGYAYTSGLLPMHKRQFVERQRESFVETSEMLAPPAESVGASRSRSENENAMDYGTAAMDNLLQDLDEDAYSLGSAESDDLFRAQAFMYRNIAESFAEGGAEQMLGDEDGWLTESGSGTESGSHDDEDWEDVEDFEGSDDDEEEEDGVEDDEDGMDADSNDGNGGQRREIHGRAPGENANSDDMDVFDDEEAVRRIEGGQEVTLAHNLARLIARSEAREGFTLEMSPDEIFMTVSALGDDMLQALGSALNLDVTNHRSVSARLRTAGIRTEEPYHLQVGKRVNATCEEVWKRNDEHDMPGLKLCGHYMHVDCLQKYKAAQKRQFRLGEAYDGHELLNVHEGEFMCPICRRLNNMIVPISPAQLSWKITEKDGMDTKVWIQKVHKNAQERMKQDLSLQSRGDLVDLGEDVSPKECLAPFAGLCAALQDCNPRLRETKIPEGLGEIPLLLEAIANTIGTVELAHRIRTKEGLVDVRDPLVSMLTAPGLSVARSLTESLRTLRCVGKDMNAFAEAIFLAQWECVMNGRTQDHPIGLRMRLHDGKLILTKVLLSYDMESPHAQQGIWSGSRSSTAAAAATASSASSVEGGDGSASSSNIRQFTCAFSPLHPLCDELFLVACRLVLLWPIGWESLSIGDLRTIFQLISTLGMAQAALYLVRGKKTGPFTASTPSLDPTTFVGAGIPRAFSNMWNMLAGNDDRMQEGWHCCCTLVKPLLYRMAALFSILSPEFSASFPHSYVRPPTVDEELDNLLDWLKLPHMKDLMDTNDTWMRPWLQRQRSISKYWLQNLRRPAPAHAFELIPLSESYQGFYQKLIKRECKQCHTVPLRPMLCLLCGELVCGSEACCSKESVAEPFWHSKECNGGNGFFLSLQLSQVPLLRMHGNTYRRTMWGSPYLDAHGEEDSGLRRGRPLFLMPWRFDQIRNFVLNGCVEHDSLVLAETTRLVAMQE
jgi:hypothetical protein